MVKNSQLERYFLQGVAAAIFIIGGYYNFYIEEKRRPQLISPDSIETYRQIQGIKTNEEIVSIVEGKPKKSN